MEKVKSVVFNWRQVGSVQDRNGAGEDYDKVEIGVKDVVFIEEFLAPEWGNLTSYKVHLKDKSSFRVFNPNLVQYFPYLEEY